MGSATAGIATRSRPPDRLDNSRARPGDKAGETSSRAELRLHDDGYGTVLTGAETPRWANRPVVGNRSSSGTEPAHMVDLAGPTVVEPQCRPCSPQFTVVPFPNLPTR
jgi:hypothetical protein